MEIISASKRLALLEFLPSIRYTLHDWVFVEIRIHDSFDESFSVAEIAELLNNLFKKHEGRVYICNTKEILMLMNCGKKPDPEKILKDVKFHLPSNSCDVEVIPSSAKGIAKLELMISPSKATQDNPFYIERSKRRENVILVADDDLYMRTLMKGIMAEIGSVFEASSGEVVEAAYRKLNPDIVFLDIHLPGRSGTELLADILKIDPDAYVVMVSSDSSRENVQATLKQGAKDFLTKPFTRPRALECLRQASTIY